MKNFWINRKVLVTGANGFLASWLVKNLLENGAEVIALNFQKNILSVFEDEHLNEHCKVVFGSILNFDLLMQILTEHEVQTIFHLGAQAICDVAIEKPALTLDINIRGTINVLEAVRLINPEISVVVASSDKAYGTHEKLPYLETFSLCGEFPYEVSKSCADLIAQMYFKTYSIPIAIVRSGNLYGGGDSHFSRVMPNTIWRINHGQQPIVMNNSIRDYLFVEDAAIGYQIIGENLPEKVAGESFNMGHGRPISVVEVITLILEEMGRTEIKPFYSNLRKQEIIEQYLSNIKIGQKIGWVPKVDLEEGIKRTVEWYLKFFDNHPYYTPKD